MKQDDIFHRQAVGAGADRSELDCSLTVNAVLAHFPSTFRVFNRFGVDTCCSGVLTVEDAARANGVDAVALCGALREAAFV